MKAFLANAVAWVIIMLGFSVVFTIANSFVALQLVTPFETVIGRLVLATFGTGLLVSMLRGGKQ